MGRVKASADRQESPVAAYIASDDLLWARTCSEEEVLDIIAAPYLPIEKTWSAQTGKTLTLPDDYFVTFQQMAKTSEEVQYLVSGISGTSMLSVRRPNSVGIVGLMSWDEIFAKMPNKTLDLLYIPQFKRAFIHVEMGTDFKVIASAILRASFEMDQFCRDFLSLFDQRISVSTGTVTQRPIKTELKAKFKPAGSAKDPLAVDFLYQGRRSKKTDPNFRGKLEDETPSACNNSIGGYSGPPPEDGQQPPTIIIDTVVIKAYAPNSDPPEGGGGGKVKQAKAKSNPNSKPKPKSKSKAKAKATPAK